MTIFRTKQPDGTAQNFWYVLGEGTASTLLLVDQTAYFIPLRVDRAFTFDKIGIDISTAAAANGVMRIGLFADAADNTTFLPGNLITDYGTFVTTGGTVVTLNTPAAAVSLAPALYWICLCPQGAPASQVTVRSAGWVPSSGLFNIPVAAGSGTPTLGAVAPGCISIASYASGAFVTTLPTITNTQMNTMAAVATIPRVVFRTTAG